MKTIFLKKLYFQNARQIGIYFSPDVDIEMLVQQIGGKYTETHRCWYIGNCPANMKEIYRALKGLVNINADAIFKKDVQTDIPAGITKVIVPGLTDEDKINKLLKFKYWMRARRYSESTVETYLGAMEIFFRFYNDKPIHKINNNDVINFNNKYILHNKYSISYQSQVINAIKSFYSNMQNKELVIEALDRPKKEHKLPNVLSKAEVKLILNAPLNLKHRAMLCLIYSCGLRCGELLKLKPAHIDSKRNIIIIQKAKGKKDRIVPLSQLILEMLRDYYRTNKPITYLFEGAVPGEPYSSRSLQKVLKQSLVKAGIKKPVTLHWLRHSYATHLLESGTDLRYIQEILGHNSSRTTEIYTHVSTKNLQQIKSPFDDL